MIMNEPKVFLESKLHSIYYQNDWEGIVVRLNKSAIILDLRKPSISNRTTW
jgi:hypothetical protein